VERAQELLAFCEEHSIKLVVGVEPHESEDITDIERALQGRQPARAAIKIGRNEPCPCGSGKKFKVCHLGREQEIMALIQAQANSRPAQPAHAAPAAPPPARRESPSVAAEAAKILQAQQQAQPKPDAQPQPPRPRTTPRGKKK